MKKITLGCSILLAAAMFFTSCNKKKANEAPEQDMEFETSKYVTYGNDVVSDLDMIVAYAGENFTSTQFFTPAPGSGSVSPSYSIGLNRDTANKKIYVTFTGSVTCRDGKKRDGSIVIDYSSSNVTYNSKFYRDAGYVAKITLNNFWVDGWYIDDAGPVTIVNNNSFGYDPSQTDLSWTTTGYFSIIPDVPADSVKKIVWNGKMTKTLTNTENTSIMAANKLSPINWARFNAAGTPTAGAICAYTGTITGVTERIISYSFIVDGAKPDKALIRDFTCSPDRIVGITTTPSITPYYSEYHPFIKGVATFSTFGPGTTEPRYIDYASGDPGAPCDKAVTVTIKGVTYNLDLMK